jgi:uncharacterized protein (TIGR00251 family)
MNEPWLRPSGDGAILILHIQPGARRSEIAGVHGEALKIRLAAPPVDGKANAALLEFLATALATAKSRLTLVAGQSSRSKRVAVHGLAVAEIRARLLPPANP